MFNNYITIEQLWNKKIPSHWKIVPLCSMAKEKSICNCNELPLLSVYLGAGVVPFEKMGTKRANATSKDLSKYQRVDPGDFVLNNQQAWRGSVGVSDYTGIVSPAYIILSLDDSLTRKYANYLMASSFMVDQFYIASKGVGSIQRNIYWPEFKRSLVVVPPRDEQDQIVRYLDWKVSRIDKLIHGYQKQIKLLEEYRLTVVDTATTQGVDNAELKDSGTHWTKKIPKHWEMVFSKKLFAERKDKAFLDDEQLTASQKYGIITQKDFMEREGRRVTVVMTGDDILKHVGKGDFVISMRSFQGGLEYSRVNGKISSAYVMLIPRAGLVYDEYFKYLLKSRPYIKALQGTSDLVRDGQALRYANFAKVQLPIIPIDEQKRIADYITHEIEKVNKEIPLIQREITLLREYRTRLISDVVTGQIDVRGVKIPDYETDENIDIDDEIAEEVETDDN